MAYTQTTFTAFEQPSTSKWNQLTGNDDEFNTRFESGWVPAILSDGSSETWTYASADSPTFTFTISGDKSTKYYAGMRIKLTQTSAKYFIITKVAYSAPNTTITIYGGTDYTLVNAAITSPYFSPSKAPAGFPLDPDKWTLSTSYSSTTSQSSPGSGTWYNLGSVSLALHIGVWYVMYKTTGQTFKTAGVATNNISVTFSTGNNTESDTDLTSLAELAFTSGVSTTIRQTFFNRKSIALTSKTTYYLNWSTTASSPDSITIVGATKPTIIKAVCAYL